LVAAVEHSTLSGLHAAAPIFGRQAVCANQIDDDIISLKSEMPPDCAKSRLISEISPFAPSAEISSLKPFHVSATVTNPSHRQHSSLVCIAVPYPKLGTVFRRPQPLEHFPNHSATLTFDAQIFAFRSETKTLFNDRSPVLRFQSLRVGIREALLSHDDRGRSQRRLDLRS
jgi:hypothetical protein